MTQITKNSDAWRSKATDRRPAAFCRPLRAGITHQHYLRRIALLVVDGKRTASGLHARPSSSGLVLKRTSPALLVTPSRRNGGIFPTPPPCPEDFRVSGRSGTAQDGALFRSVQGCLD